MEHSPTAHDVEYLNVHDVVPHYGLIREDTPIVVPDVAHQEFDAILLHYTLISLRAAGQPFYRWKAHVDWIRTVDAIKVAMPQDEGSYADVLDEWLCELGVDIVFSVHFRPQRELYPRLRRRAAILPCFPGYIESRVAHALEPQLRPLAERSVDLVYRARNLPYRIGRYGQLKHRISAIAEPARARGFNCDISTLEADTVLGDQWLQFLASGRAVLGIQGGYSAIDWRGELAAQLEQMLRNQPNLTFDEFDASLPNGWDGRDWFTITPRHFEAVITKTAQILVAGAYRGVLEPHRHYIPLAPDLSNTAAVLEALRDVDGLQAMAQRAYEDICLSDRYSYRAFAVEVERAIEDQLEQRRHNMATQPHMANPQSSPELEALQQELFSARQHNALMQHQLAELSETLAATVATAAGAAVQQGLSDRVSADDRLQAELTKTASELAELRNQVDAEQERARERAEAHRRAMATQLAVIIAGLIVGALLGTAIAIQL